MGAFIGPLGGLIEATQWKEKQSVSTGTAPSFFTGLDGARTAFVQPPAGRTLREWDVSMSGARPEDAAAFHTLVLGGFGNGPFVFADPLAQVTNLLTPRQSLMEPTALITTGPGQPRSNISPAVMIAPGGGRASGGVVTSASTGFWAYMTPIHPSKPVTMSLLVQGQATVALLVMRADRTWSVVATQSTTVNHLNPQRVSLTARPPYGDAVMCGIRIITTQAVTVAQPQITWTVQPMPWAPGRGANQVIVHGLSESFDRADPHLGGVRRLEYGGGKRCVEASGLMTRSVRSRPPRRGSCRRSVVWRSRGHCPQRCPGSSRWVGMRRRMGQ